jgi:gamma-butyrobetaine dioxygenase
MSLVSAEILQAGAVLRVHWSKGSSNDLSSLWLRDNHPAHCDPNSGQRFLDILDVPVDPLLVAAEVVADHLYVTWQGDTAPVLFNYQWLQRRVELGKARPEVQLRYWLEAQHLDAHSDFQRISLETLRMDEASRLQWLTGLLQDGLAFLSSVPTEGGAILEAMKWVGTVPETNYGYVFDVRAVPQPENLAYSDLGLGLHTDNPYREPVPGYQALHTLVASPDGGDSLFTDGFALAEYLRTNHPEAFALLTRTPVLFEYVSHNADLYAERPLIELSCRGEVEAVCYNNRSIRPPCLPPADATAFYAAYRAYATLLREPRFQMRTRLENGELVVFDNRRTFHGRTAFVSAQHPRHLQGCYLTRDSIHSEAGQLRRRLAGKRM